MTAHLTQEKMQAPVREHMRKDFVQLHPDLTVAEALDLILEKQPAGRIIYFYVADGEGRLQGVVPTRRLLLSPRSTPLSSIVVTPVVSIPQNATLLEACEFFILHRLLAFPVVDEARRIIGLVDIDVYTRELSDLDRSENFRDLFQLIGVHATEAQPRSILSLVRQRLPWLVATLAGGLGAAAITDFFLEVASRPRVVPYVPLILALAGSITAQSVSLAVQSLRGKVSTRSALLPKFKFELATGGLLGLACGVLAGTAVYIWNGDSIAALCLVTSMVASAAGAAVLGLVMPYLVHALNRNPQVATGPVALASADALTLLLYYTVARGLLG